MRLYKFYKRFLSIILLTIVSLLLSGSFGIAQNSIQNRFISINADQSFPKKISQKLDAHWKKTVNKMKYGGIILRVDINDASWRGSGGNSMINKCCKTPREYSVNFRIASITKFFVSSVALKLVEEGIYNQRH